MRFCARPVHAGSLSSLVCALGVIRFIRGCWVHRGAPWGSLGLSRVAVLYRVHPGDRRDHPGSLGSLGLSSSTSGFIWVRPRGRRVSLGSLGCALGVVGFTAVAGYIEVRPEDGRGHSGSLRSLGAPWASSDSSGVIAPWWSSGSSGVAGLIVARPWVHWVRQGLLG